MIEPFDPLGEPMGDTASLLERAMAAHQRGELDSAETLYATILAREPDQFTATHLLGVLKTQRGDFQAAVQLLTGALTLNPRSALAHLNLGLALWNLDRCEEALAHYRFSLRLNPGNRDTLANAALALEALQRPEEALPLWNQLLALNPKDAPALLNLGMLLQDLQRSGEAMTRFGQALALDEGLAENLLHRARELRLALRHEDALATVEKLLESRPDWLEALLVCGIVLVDLQRAEAALELYDRVLLHHPESADAFLDRGNVLMGLQRYEEALASYERVLVLVPQHADGLMNSGSALLKLHRPQEALAGFDQALALRPEHADSYLNRGNAQLNLGRPLEALASYERALTLRPENPEALLNRANALLALNRPAEALASCDRALALQPECVDALVNRGTALLDLRRPEEALASYDTALALKPKFPDLLMNRGTALHLLGRHREAIASYDQVLALDPRHARAHSNKIYLLDFIPEVGFPEHQQERRSYFEAQAKELASQGIPPSNDRTPSRRLILGYVSADFKHHSAASCFLPVLQRHSRVDFQINCYSGVQVEDDWTRRFRACAEVWRSTVGLSDEELAAQIRDDGVDILIDLSGHSKGNRLLAFARKPAPIQVTAWGHGGGTGLPMMDYQFTDPVSIPMSARSLFAEEAFDLPCCITFEAPAFAPPIAALPARHRGFVTYGSLNRFTKVTPEVESLWARILVAVPGSHLLLKDRRFDDAENRSRILAAFAELGIGPDRMDLRGFSSHQEHLAACGEVDIMLDTFPQNGGITTWEALWMGTPVVAMLGNKASSRVSGAILQALDLGGWVGRDETEYLAVAIRQAANLEALAQFRLGIRARILSSSAGDPNQYTREVEEAYRVMWRRWIVR